MIWFSLVLCAEYVTRLGFLPNTERILVIYWLLNQFLLWITLRFSADYWFTVSTELNTDLVSVLIVELT